ncbi:rRNA processing/ribosome biogenesis-domain-containing protein [Chlamydoabsidia padenii]|nr:rRNA processing/ribosome biogenesis-domain-containing protein [Chlamydoabsidia padenii]
MSSTSNHDFLAQITSCYLNNDSTLHDNLPFIMDTILTRSLLTDQEETEQMTAVRRKWTIRLNSLMQSKQSTARWAAIVLIKLTCQQSPSLLYGHIRSWTGQLMGVVAKPATVVSHKVAIETLSYLFSYTSNKPELQREITIPNLPRFNQLLLGLSKDEGLLPVVLKALNNSIVHFPSQSRHIADQSLKLSLSCLDGRINIDKETILAACECLASLHHVTGKLNCSDHWKDIMLHLIGSVHGCLDRLFGTIDEELELPELPPSYPLSDLSPDPIEAFPVILRRIRSFNQAIITCLGSQTMTVVSVPIVQLVDLVCRVYNVFDGSPMREFMDKSEFFCLMSCLPSLHLATNKMVSALLLSSGCHLSRYNKLFSRILIRLLHDYKSQRTLKISVYNIISLCLQHFGHVFGGSVCKPLIASVLEDIQVIEQKVTDLVPTEIKNKSGKRKRDGLTNSDLLANAGQSTQGPHDIQMSALDSLQDLLQCYGCAMDLHSRNTIDAKLISRLLMFSQNTLGSITEGELLVKERLYQCLLASIMNPIEVQATVLPHAIRIFSAGVNEHNHKLQTICKQGLSICNLIIHPRMPPIQSSLNTLNTKLNQAERSIETVNDVKPAMTISYPTPRSAVSPTATESTIIHLPPQANDPEKQQPVNVESDSLDAQPQTPTEHDSTTSPPGLIDTIMGILTSRVNEFVSEPANKIDTLDDDSSKVDQEPANIIRLDDVEDEVESTLSTTNTTNKEEIHAPIQTDRLPTSNIITLDGLDDADADDMNLPEIDMAGPDTDEDDD